LIVRRQNETKAARRGTPLDFCHLEKERKRIQISNVNKRFFYESAAFRNSFSRRYNCLRQILKMLADAAKKRRLPVVM